MSENDLLESSSNGGGGVEVAPVRVEAAPVSPVQVSVSADAGAAPAEPSDASPAAKGGDDARKPRKRTRGKSSAPKSQDAAPSSGDTTASAPAEPSDASPAAKGGDDARKPRKRTRGKSSAPKSQDAAPSSGDTTASAPVQDSPAPAVDQVESSGGSKGDEPQQPKKSQRKRTRKPKEQGPADAAPSAAPDGEGTPVQEPRAQVSGDTSSKEHRTASLEGEGQRVAPASSSTVPAGEMSLEDLMTNLPRRGRGRPSKRDLEARKALEAAIANPTPELVELARSAAEAIIGSSSKKKGKKPANPEHPAPVEPKEEQPGQAVERVEAEEAAPAVAEGSERSGAPAADGSYGTRRRHHERRGDGQDERRQKGQSGDQAKQQSQQDRRDRDRDRDRGRDQQRQRDNRDRQNGYNGQSQNSSQGSNRQRDNRDRQNGYNGQSQQFGKNGRNGKNGQRQRDYVVEPKTNREELEELKVSDLRTKAAELGIDSAGLKKPELVDAVYSALVKQEGFFEFTGILDLTNEGFGFIRTKGYLASERDVYIGASIVRQNGLRRGDEVSGIAHAGRPNDKYPAIARVTLVNGKSPEEMKGRPRFGDLTPVFPTEPLRMEHGKDSILGRCIDLVAPIGKGQRGLIVSPPKAGKTTVLKKIAESIAANNPEVHLICLLVDERPEEVTDMQRCIKGEVVASTFDMPSDNHITVSELVIERAKRLVELGEDVVILLDSITRLARAYNLAQPASGRILSGGVDSTALYPPKRFLGAARNIENGGSLTILASALVDTGSKMDEVIFEEFKGTGNMELKLDRDLADRRIFPAIDPVASGTRKEELLLDPSIAPFVWGIRRILSNMNNNERAMSTLIRSLKATANNEEFLIRSAKKAQNQELGVGDL